MYLILAGKSGDKVEFSEVLLHDNDGKISVGGDVKVTVKAEIINDLIKGEKVIAFKMKRRKGFQKKAWTSYPVHANKSN